MSFRRQKARIGRGQSLAPGERRPHGCGDAGLASHGRSLGTSPEKAQVTFLTEPNNRGAMRSRRLRNLYSKGWFPHDRLSSPCPPILRMITIKYSFQEWAIRKVRSLRAVSSQIALPV